jgi:hypothetical protein
MSGMLLAVMGGGGSGIVNPIPINNFSDIAIDPADATAALIFNSDGSGEMNGTVSNPFSWFEPETVGIGSSYWIRLTVNSGTSPSGTVGVWLALSSSRSWTLTRTTIGVSTGNYTLEIASDSGGVSVVASASITMTADVEA